MRHIILVGGPKHLERYEIGAKFIHLGFMDNGEQYWSYSLTVKDRYNVEYWSCDQQEPSNQQRNEAVSIVLDQVIPEVKESVSY